MGEFDKIVSFLDGINDEKFSGWKDKEYTIADNSKLGFRLDHQGVRLELIAALLTASPYVMLMLIGQQRH